MRKSYSYKIIQKDLTDTLIEDGKTNVMWNFINDFQDGKISIELIFDDKEIEETVEKL